MKIIGFCSGPSCFGVGTSSDMILFINSMKNYAFNEDLYSENLLGKLFQTYIKDEELPAFKALIEYAYAIFAKSITTKKDLVELDINFDNTLLDFSDMTLSILFSKHFSMLQKAIDSAFYFQGKGFKPLRIIDTSLQGFAYEYDKSLEDYDNNQYNPFWV